MMQLHKVLWHPETELQAQQAEFQTKLDGEMADMAELRGQLKERERMGARCALLLTQLACTCMFTKAYSTYIRNIARMLQCMWHQLEQHMHMWLTNAMRM